MPLTPVPATPDNIQLAAEHLRGGNLVAFPTETVYGLGADARNGKAVASIFAAKGRPKFNPLIIHVADLEAASQCAEIGPLAQRLAAAFWPGGLTMVLHRRDDSNLSDLVSAGLPSIAIRVPSHPVAIELLRAVGFPVAAPSANRSGHVSATTAGHVVADFAQTAVLEPNAVVNSTSTVEPAPLLAMILDGGPCPFGLESTIIDVREDTPRLLRPGAVTIEELTKVAGATVLSEPPAASGTDSAARTSPGQLESHYAPSKPVFMNVEYPASDQALLAFGTSPPDHSGPSVNLSPTGDLVEAAANLFAALRKLDNSSAGSIAAMPVPNTGLGRAINDRLRRAAAPRADPSQA